MTFGDLKNMEGQIIDYYEIKGNSIKAKRGKVVRTCYNDNINIQFVDKLGRLHPYIYYAIYYNGGIYNSGIDVSKSTVYDCGYCKLYLNKEEVCHHILHKLRLEKLKINKKIISIQKLLCSVENGVE